MRAATAIVGAIAVASILVALSLIVSGDGDSGQAVVTKTVIEEVAAPRAQSDGPTACGTELSVENTSCVVGEQIHAGYVRGGRDELSAKDTETGRAITLRCEDETSPVTCKGDDGAVVYFEP